MGGLFVPPVYLLVSWRRILVFRGFSVTFQGLILKIVAYEKDGDVLVGVRVGGVW